MGLDFTGPIKYYYFFLVVMVIVIVINLRLQDSRIGRAWEAIREDEVAARAMGINTRNIKLLAFAMGASFGGVAGGMFSAIQGFISPESFVLVESVMVLAMVVLGGMGNIWGVILGAILLSFVPEVLRYTVAPLQEALFGRMLLDPEVIRMLLFGLALVLMMLFRPAGILPSAVRKRELRRPRRADPCAAAPIAWMTQVLLSAKGITKRFGGVQALSDVGFTINHGEIYGLIGPNGAGKTSLFNVLTGIYVPDGGEFMFDGATLANLKPNDVASRGIARTFQNIRLFGNLSALENVMIGRHVRTHAGVWGAIFAQRARRCEEEREIHKRAYELLEYVGVAKRANSLARHLAVRRPAPARDRARARHRAQAPRARRARGRA